jgi:transposase
VTQTLETTPRRWKVIETVREKFSCRDCETISQAPAPFHVIPRAWAGPSLLAMIVFEKFGQHQPLNRQADRYALEGAPIALSTMADAVGAVSTVLDPLRRLIEVHVMAAERLHGDDTTVPVLAKGKTDTGRLWIYVRDDQPFGGAGPPAAIFHYSHDRRGEHPQAHLAGYAGILQADAYDGYNKLYLADRKPAPIREAACWVHARRPFFAMADIEENARRKASGKKEIPLSPIAIEVVRRIDAEKRESSARRSGLGRSLGRLFLPRHHHPLVGLLGTPNVVGFSLSDLLDPIVATWSRLAIFAWSAGLERSFA